MNIFLQTYPFFVTSKPISRFSPLQILVKGIYKHLIYCKLHHYARSILTFCVMFIDDWSCRVMYERTRYSIRIKRQPKCEWKRGRYSLKVWLSDDSIFDLLFIFSSMTVTWLYLSWPYLFSLMRYRRSHLCHSFTKSNRRICTWSYFYRWDENKIYECVVFFLDNCGGSK